jgi:chemotaxis response regulator CheB
MPRHAIATGVVDLVVPLEDIARTIMQLVSATNEPVAETA